jgi:hypothetical protein
MSQGNRVCRSRVVRAIPLHFQSLSELNINPSRRGNFDPCPSSSIVATCTRAHLTGFSEEEASSSSACSSSLDAGAVRSGVPAVAFFPGLGSFFCWLTRSRWATVLSETGPRIGPGCLLCRVEQSEMFLSNIHLDLRLVLQVAAIPVRIYACTCSLY